MADSHADRNLLLGILALQMDFVSREALIAAMSAWVLAKSRSLGEILREQGALNEDHQALLDALVVAHLNQHGNDPERSLAAVSSLRSVRDELEQIADPDVQASLSHVINGGADADPWRTISLSSARPTSDGGRFRVLRPHARGGLGEVFVASDDELHREVALKQIQDRYADDQSSRARFVLEAEITGGLEHPGIVPVYGLGTYADGRPYYAMRFIRGDSLKDAIERFHKADVAGREPGERTLELRKLLGRFIDVCNAIEYAHSRGVLHRDLKPGNIMLGKYGETLVVDWGLAKAVGRSGPSHEEAETSLRPSGASGSAPTQMGAAVGTPAYMSPEQAAGRLDLLGPSSDVYSLGATLYSLLTGQAPLHDLANGEMLQKVQQGDFPAPREVKKQTPSTLESICLKAMALKPQDRYASPRLLADDLEHWLADEPVTAHAESLSQRLTRFGRRHRAWVRAAAAALALVACFAIVAAILVNRSREQALAAADSEASERKRAEENLVEANHQRKRADEKAVEALTEKQHAEQAEAKATEDAQRAQLEAEKSKQVARFLSQMFEASRPQNFDGTGFTGIRFSRGEGDSDQRLTARQLLDRGAKKVQDELQDQPAVQAALLDTIGSVYLSLGIPGEAEHLINSALESRRRLYPDGDLEASTTLHNLALLRLVQGRFDVAADAARESLSIRERLLGEENSSVNDARLTYAVLLTLQGYVEGEFSEDSEKLMRQVLNWRRDHLGKDHPHTAYAMIGLAAVLLNKIEAKESNDVAEVAMLFSGSATILVRDPETKTAGMAIIEFQRSRLMWALKQWSAAADASTKGIEKFREAFGERHPLFSMLADIHVRSLLRADRVGDAEVFCRMWNADLRQREDPRDFLLLLAQAHLARVLIEKAKQDSDPKVLDDAEETYRSAAAIARERRISPPDDLTVAAKAIAERLKTREPARAEALFREAFELARSALADDDAKGRKIDERNFGKVSEDYGLTLVRNKKFEDAVGLYRDMKSLGERYHSDMLILRATTGMADLRQDQKQYAEALVLFEESLRLVDPAFSKDPKMRVHWATSLHYDIGSCQQALGKKQEAEASFRQAIKLGNKDWAPDAKVALAELLNQRGEGVEARGLLRSVLVGRPESEGEWSDWIDAWVALADLLRKEKADPEELASVVREAEQLLPSVRKSIGQQHGDVARLLAGIGRTLCARGDFAAAEPLLNECLTIRRSIYPPESWQCGHAQLLCGECSLGLGKHAEAEILLLGSYSTLDALGEKESMRTHRALEALVQLYEGCQKPEKAAEYREILSSR